MTTKLLFIFGAQRAALLSAETLPKPPQHVSRRCCHSRRAAMRAKFSSGA